MENADVFLGLHDFLERMRQPAAADFVKAIKSFIVSFSNNAPDPERDSAAVQEFFANMEAAFKAHPLWSGCSDEELESAGEFLISALDLGMVELGYPYNDYNPLLRPCPISEWTFLDGDSHDVSVGYNFRTWLIKNIRGPQEFLFLSSLWWLWKWRNNIVFENHPWTIENVVRNILVMKDEMIHSAVDSQTFSTLWWQPPPVGYTKLNLDGSYNHSNNTMGSGGVMRDANGTWLWGFSGCHGPGNALLAELIAIKEGLTLAWEHNHRKFICESDCLEALHLLQNASSSNDRFTGFVLAEVRELLARNWEVQLVHTLRDANMVADHLAKIKNNGSHQFLSYCWLYFSPQPSKHGLEKYVMTKLFARVFASLPDDVKLDDQLSEKMALIQQFIRPENLDIKPAFQNETSWLLAQKELQKINMYKAPRDKLVCILNCCKVIGNLLLNASVASKENPPGADEFLPVLIYVTIKANPPQLHSNLLYIQRFRRQSRLVAEAAYYFTNMLSAESFISNIDAKAISMDENEFERNMEFARALLSGLSVDTQDPNSPYQNYGQHPIAEPTKHRNKALNYNKDPALRTPSSVAKSESKKVTFADELLITKVPSLSDLENKGASMILKEDKLNDVFREFPFLFASVGDLTVGDVEDLLNNYKQLVFKYVCLSKGLGVSSTSHAPSNPQSNAQDHAETTIDSSDDGAVGSNDKSENSTDTTEDNSDKVSPIEEKKSESVLPQDEAVASEGGDPS